VRRAPPMELETDSHRTSVFARVFQKIWKHLADLFFPRVVEQESHIGERIRLDVEW